MGELGTICRYAYWSDRRIRSIATDNGIDLSRRWRLGFKTPVLGFLPQAELDKGRWNLRPSGDSLELVDRIVIGAPLWARSNGR